MRIESLIPVWVALEKVGIDTRSTHVRKLGLCRVSDMVHVFNYGLTAEEVISVRKAVEGMGMEVTFHEDEAIDITPGGY